MLMLGRCRTFCLPMALILLPVLASAQESRTVRWQDSSAKALLAATRGSRFTLQGVLRQTEISVPKTTLDVIGDSLVRRILIGPFASHDQMLEQAGNLLVELHLSGSGEGGGVPYTGALSRIIRVGRETHDEQLKISVLGVVLGSGSIEEATEYLATEAMKPDSPTAGFAMSRLTLVLENEWLNSRKATPEEITVLRRTLKRIWDASWHVGNEKGLRLHPDAGRPLSRTACLEGWWVPASACANITRFPRGNR